jgi:hypothetical protein
MIYIYHHLGLGDHIICNGLVRYFQEIYGNISVFCKLQNIQNVKYMYRDNQKISVFGVNDDVDVVKFINENNLQNDSIIVGFGNLGVVSHSKFDEGFYKTVNLPFEYRFSKFYLERNLEKEKKIFDEINPSNEKYIFVHGVDLSKVRKDLKIISNPTNYGLFDLMYLIENAEEVHVMESSIKNLINSFEIKKPKFFYHQYSRMYPEYNNTQGLNKFEIIF